MKQLIIYCLSTLASSSQICKRYQSNGLPITDNTILLNGDLPGPLVESEVGASLNYTVKNDFSSTISFHIHGAELNYDDDIIKLNPGESYTLDTIVPTPGLKWYHDHSNAFERIGRHHAYGPLIVREKGGLEEEIKLLLGNDIASKVSSSEILIHEEILMLSDNAWQVRQNMLNQSSSSQVGGDHDGWWGSEIIVNGMNVTSAGIDNLLNGKVILHASGCEYENEKSEGLREGDFLRLRIANVAPGRFIRIGILQLENDDPTTHQIFLVGGDGGFNRFARSIPPVRMESSNQANFCPSAPLLAQEDGAPGGVVLSPGERADLLVHIGGGPFSLMVFDVDSGRVRSGNGTEVANWTADLMQNLLESEGGLQELIGAIKAGKVETASGGHEHHGSHYHHANHAMQDNTSKLNHFTSSDVEGTFTYAHHPSSHHGLMHHAPNGSNQERTAGGSSNSSSAGGDADRSVDTASPSTVSLDELISVLENIYPTIHAQLTSSPSFPPYLPTVLLPSLSDSSLVHITLQYLNALLSDPSVISILPSPCSGKLLPVTRLLSLIPSPRASTNSSFSPPSTLKHTVPPFPAAGLVAAVAPIKLSLGHDMPPQSSSTINMFILQEAISSYRSVNLDNFDAPQLSKLLTASEIEEMLPHTMRASIQSKHDHQHAYHAENDTFHSNMRQVATEDVSSHHNHYSHTEEQNAAETSPGIMKLRGSLTTKASTVSLPIQRIKILSSSPSDFPFGSVLTVHNPMEALHNLHFHGIRLMPLDHPLYPVPAWKDSVILPKSSTITLLVGDETAIMQESGLVRSRASLESNLLLAHCHMLRHHEIGMYTWLAIDASFPVQWNPKEEAAVDSQSLINFFSSLYSAGGGITQSRPLTRDSWNISLAISLVVLTVAIVAYFQFISREKQKRLGDSSGTRMRKGWRRLDLVSNAPAPLKFAHGENDTTCATLTCVSAQIPIGRLRDAYEDVLDMASDEVIESSAVQEDNDKILCSPTIKKESKMSSRSPFKWAENNNHFHTT